MQHRFTDIARSIDPPDVSLSRHGEEVEVFEHKIGDQTFKIPVKAGDVNLQEFVTTLTKTSGGAAAAARKDAEARYKSQIETLLTDKTKTQSERDALQAQLEALELDKLSAEEKAKKIYEKKIEELSKTSLANMDLANRNLALFHENKINNDIHSALAGYELVDAEQTLLLMRNYGRPTAVEETPGSNKWKTVLKFSMDDGEEEMDAKTFAQKFLALPRFANQLKNSLLPGGGTGSGAGHRSPNGNLVFKLSDMRKPGEEGKKFRVAYDKALSENPNSVEVIKD